jgi:hypothetical protein
MRKSRANSWDIRGEFIGIMGNLLGNQWKSWENPGKSLLLYPSSLHLSMGAIPHWMV